jgi:homogentisate 1,2-dioxygenase
VPTPYNHANVDSDEVLFYCAGDFTSRKGAGIGAGSISLHPGGFTHGPQPGSVEASLGAESTDELAVMIDTFAPLALAGAARECEDPDYAWTWAAAAR